MSARQASAPAGRDGAVSPTGRRAIRERAEAAALAEVEDAARLRRERTKSLRRLRLKRDED
jgi:hypothetical protein